ncbi:hypothetical protein [Alsobacter metallidurans]|nr:hypothetical protein [Alsobacter metallidurans]
MNEPAIWVSGGDLRDALALVTVAVRRNTAIVRFDFLDDCLEITGPGATTRIDAEGDLREGAVLVNGGSLRRFIAVMPKDPKLRLQTRAGRLFIGNTGFEGQSHAVAPEPITLPIGSGVLGTLAAIAREGELVVRASIGAAEIAAAKQDYNRRIDEAFRQLGPLGVTRETLEAAVDASVRAPRR